MSVRQIGYLVPEFPGQTHNFFWREIQSLRAQGLHVHLVSTRRPPMGVRSTSWGAEVEAETTYLYPLKLSELPLLLGVLAAAGPTGWKRCVQGIWAAEAATIGRRFRMLGLAALAAKLVLTARRQGWRHVHVHSCADSANIALIARWLHAIEYSMTLHNSLDVHGGNQRQKWQNASFAIVITDAIRDEVRTTLADSVPERIEVAPMGVNPSVFARTRSYQPYGGAGELRIFSCARLNRAKGHRFLIEAIARLRAEGLDAVLEIAGEDERGGRGHRLELESLVRALGVGQHVTLLGAVSEEQVRECLLRAHVFALASLAEPLGVAIMEAMAMEVPVIATMAGGVPELVSDGEDGLLVPPGDADAIASAIRMLATRSELAERLSRRSRTKICERFSSRRSAEAIASLLGVTELASR